MKKVFLSILFFACLSVELFSAPIMELRKTNRGLFGYEDVDAKIKNYTGPDGVTFQGWAITCFGHGSTWCRKPAGGVALNTDPEATIADEYDYGVAEELIDYSDDQTLNGTSSGVHTITRQVTGQSFQRVYTVTWATLANGDFTYLVDMVYVIV